jgi:hypothetical protein
MWNFSLHRMYTHAHVPTQYVRDISAELSHQVQGLIFPALMLLLVLVLRPSLARSLVAPTFFRVSVPLKRNYRIFSSRIFLFPSCVQLPEIFDQASYLLGFFQ